jgi:glycerol-3-phosphate cytidylyltransferase
MKVGYTTGVFDLFHIGHLNILKKAKEKCDYLIVGVTTDEEVKRIKNQISIISFEERKQIIEALRYVDKVVPEHDTDKLKAWEEFKYNIIFKGDDWKGTEKWNNYEKEFSKLGVEVVYFPYTEGTSSSILREFIHNFNKAGAK